MSTISQENWKKYFNNKRYQKKDHDTKQYGSYNSSKTRQTKVCLTLEESMPKLLFQSSRMGDFPHLPNVLYSLNSQ